MNPAPESAATPEEPAGIVSDPAERFEVASLLAHPVGDLAGPQAAWAQAALHSAAWRLRSMYGMHTGRSELLPGPHTWWALSLIACGARLEVPAHGTEPGCIYSVTEQALYDELRRRAAVEFDHRSAPVGLLVALAKSNEPKDPLVRAVHAVRAEGLPLLMLDPVEKVVTRENW